MDQLWDDHTLRSLAAPCGDRAALTRLLGEYHANWRAALSARQGRSPLLSAQLGRASAEIESRGTDPVFMAWVHCLEASLDVPEACELESAPDPACAPRLGHGRFVRLRLTDCPQLARMLYPPEKESTLAADVIDHEVAEALDLLGAVWPEAICDLETFARALFVIESPAGLYSSGSDASMPFILKVTCAPGSWPALLADSLVHEVAHVKLRIAMRLATFCDKDETPRFRHPWRADERPLRAVILAAHAFVSIFGWYARLAQTDSHHHAAGLEARRLRSEVGTAIASLRGAIGLTELGRRLTSHLAAAFEADCGRIRSLTCPQ